MTAFKRDPFYVSSARELREANQQGVCARRDAAQRTFDAYVKAAAQLSEGERQYAIACNLPATALVKARATLSAAVYDAAIAAGKPLPSERAPALPRSNPTIRGVDVGMVTRIVR